MKIAILQFPGINREQDMVMAVAKATGQQADMIWHRETSLKNYDVIILPGGFSFGDYLRSGAIAARSPIMQAVHEAAKQGKMILGVCNGFQILTEAGLLPGALVRNCRLKFICDDVYVKVDDGRSPWLSHYQTGQVLRWPIANNDGNYLADEETLRRLQGEGQICLTYCDEHGQASDEANPNGSAAHIAGITDKTGRILGMMPHPENAIQFSLPTSGGYGACDQPRADGLGLFQALLQRTILA